MPDCIFCLISQKKIPSEILYEDEDCMAFKDINPEAPVHILIIPKKHIESVMELTEEDSGIISKIFNVAKLLSSELKIANSGFRIVSNCGKDGGQTVGHLHFHLLGGRQLQWPPG
ncbi:HIT-like protein [Oxobacter pfennigii]|uniref:HIT-like protein n=1 Tax=Oxobacter pfennigii TaxID=36849 RepID=A0A0N8NT84_9CLOT|nr:histidine triad nucleotide-binding protein [Oxobacter pfennigii]KPU44120.1 HIT-like protein [Oxobacter pfennigii]